MSNYGSTCSETTLVDTIYNEKQAAAVAVTSKPNEQGYDICTPKLPKEGHSLLPWKEHLATFSSDERQILRRYRPVSRQIVRSRVSLTDDLWPINTFYMITNLIHPVERYSFMLRLYYDAPCVLCRRAESPRGKTSFERPCFDLFDENMAAVGVADIFKDVVALMNPRTREIFARQYWREAYLASDGQPVFNAIYSRVKAPKLKRLFGVFCERGLDRPIYIEDLDLKGHVVYGIF